MVIFSSAYCEMKSQSCSSDVSLVKHAYQLTVFSHTYLVNCLLT